MIGKLSNDGEMSLTDAKTNFIIDEAIALFLERSISEVTVHDIAACASVGEATIYRYFCTKQNLVCSAASKLQKQIYETYFDLSRGKSGYDKLELFFKTYLEIFSTHREFFKFINEFDAFILSVGETDSTEYSSGLDMFKALCVDAYTLGISDGSIARIDDFETFYYAATHALLELCKKLSSPDIVRQDVSAKKEQEIATLTDIILFRLKAKA